MQHAYFKKKSVSCPQERQRRLVLICFMSVLGELSNVSLRSSQSSMQLLIFQGERLNLLCQNLHGSPHVLDDLVFFENGSCQMLLKLPQTLLVSADALRRILHLLTAVVKLHTEGCCTIYRCSTHSGLLCQITEMQPPISLCRLSPQQPFHRQT